MRAIPAMQRTIEKIHRRTAKKAGDEEIRRLVIDLQRTIHLLNDAILHHDDARAHGHGFDLIVRHVDHRRLEALVEFRDFRAHLNAHLGIEIRERLVEEKNLRLAHDGATDRNALTLATGKGLRPAIEKLLDAQDARSFQDALLDLRFRILSQFQTECHVVVDAHMRVERVVLENHRDVTVFRRKIVDALVANQDIALRDLFETGDHSQGRRLSTARRADENDELPVGNLKAEILHRGDFLASALQGRSCKRF